jgi:DHA1 family tetracycline resistance protein-like MFS transporter
VSGASSTYRRLLRREVIDLCLLIFLADVVVGIQIPVFPLYAVALGSSLGLLGLITATRGLTWLVASVPIGVLSDRLDRKTLLTAGMLVYAVAFVLYAIAPSPAWIFLPRALQAVAMVATFPLGIAYIGDVVEKRDRGAAIGVYTAAMGTGFAVGPLIGSWVGSTAGYPASFMTGALLALAGAAFAWRRLIAKKVLQEEGTVRARALDLQALRVLLREPGVVMACAANMAMTFSMSGAIFTYFPVYARGAGISTVTIGSLFAWRAFASASGRIPMGPISNRLPAHWALPAVLLGEAGIVLAISRTESVVILTFLLIFEGLCFGVFLVSSQSAVSAASSDTNRGAAIGMFWMAGSFGELFGLSGLGIIAQWFGVIFAFETVSGVVLVAAIAILGVGLVAHSRATREAARAI